MKGIALQLLETLRYLGSRRPPITHRCCRTAPPCTSRKPLSIRPLSCSSDASAFRKSNCAEDCPPNGMLPGRNAACDGITTLGASEQSSHAHRRDIKPENVVIEGGKPGGRVFLVDFGGVQASVSAVAWLCQ